MMSAPTRHSARGQARSTGGAARIARTGQLHAAGEDGPVGPCLKAPDAELRLGSHRGEDRFDDGRKGRQVRRAMSRAPGGGIEASHYQAADHMVDEFAGPAGNEIF